MKKAKETGFWPDGKPFLSDKDFRAQKKLRPKKNEKKKKEGLPRQKKDKKVQKKERVYKKPPPVAVAVNAQTVINIPATFAVPAVQNMWLALISRMFEKGWNSMQTVPPLGDVYIQDAYVILQTLTSQYMTSETPTVQKLSYWIEVVFNLLAPKQVSFELAEIKYTWASGFPANIDSVVTVFLAGRPYLWVFGSPDQASSLTATNFITPFTYDPLATDPTNLQIALGLLVQDGNPDTKLVATDSVQLGKRDASAFARTFEYLGGGNSLAGGAYGEGEMETSHVKSHIPCQFSVFGNNDTRVSRSFRIKSCDSCLLATLPLIHGYRMRDFKTPGPVIVKFIDFEEIYSWYTQWLALAWTQALQVPTNLPVNSILATPLPFSVQTFRIILRQAILQCFVDQSTVQFLCPKIASSNNDCVFIPFLTSAATYSASLYGTMKFPLVLAENIKMLKTSVLRLTENKNVVVTHMPCLGTWVGDTYFNDPQLTFPIVFPGQGSLLPPMTPSSIFGLGPGSEPEVDLVDGTLAAPAGTFLNFNSTYFQSSVDMLNNLLSLLTNTGGPLSTVAGDSGPGLSLLNFTRYIQTLNVDQRSKSMRRGELLIEHVERLTELKKTTSQKKLIKVAPEIVTERYRVPPTDSNRFQHRDAPLGKIRDEDMHGRTKTNLTINPDGGVGVDVTTAISSNMIMSQDMQAFLKMVVIPTIRPDPVDASYPQIASEWQIAYVEPNLVSYNIGGDVAVCSTFRVDDIFEAAAAQVTSITNGQDSSDIVAVFKKLVETSTGPDWMGILSGVVGAGLSIAKAVM
jgi:hypothetical protein